MAWQVPFAEQPAATSNAQAKAPGAEQSESVTQALPIPLTLPEAPLVHPLSQLPVTPPEASLATPEAAPLPPLTTPPPPSIEPVTAPLVPSTSLPLAALGLVPLVRPPQPTATSAAHAAARDAPRTGRLIPQSDIGTFRLRHGRASSPLTIRPGLDEQRHDYGLPSGCLTDLRCLDPSPGPFRGVPLSLWPTRRELPWLG